MSRAEDLAADGEPEIEFHEGVAGRMPRKRVAAMALIRDRAGRIVMVEPIYKPTWDLPGGVVEADESPLAACRREVGEELGLDVPLARLLALGRAPAARRAPGAGRRRGRARVPGVRTTRPAVARSTRPAGSDPGAASA